MIEGKKMNTYHIYSEGDLVLFRDNSDKIYFNNKFAAVCHKCSVEALGLDILSTHFHSIVNAADDSQIEEMANMLKVSYGLHYRYKYGHPIGNKFKISFPTILGKEKIRDKLLYVMTNSVHHFVTDSPFKDQFSSANYIFTSEYLPVNFRQALAGHVTEFGKLPARKQKELMNADIIPNNYLVAPDGMIWHNSFINVQKTRLYFNNSFNSFRYYIDTEVKDTRKQSITENRQAVLCDGLDDEVVCREIDQFAAGHKHKSFHFLSDQEILRLKGISVEQRRRCLWLQERKMHQ